MSADFDHSGSKRCIEIVDIGNMKVKHFCAINSVFKENRRRDFGNSSNQIRRYRLEDTIFHGVLKDFRAGETMMSAFK